MNLSSQVNLPTYRQWPTWNGEFRAIPELLASRRKIADDNLERVRNYYETIDIPYMRDYHKRSVKNLQRVIEHELAVQEEFAEALRAIYNEQLMYINGSPYVSDGARSRRRTKLERQWSGTGIEGLPE